MLICWFVSVLAGRALLDKHRFPWAGVFLGVQGVGESIKIYNLLEVQQRKQFKAIAVKFLSAGRDSHGVCNGLLEDV